MKKIIFLIFLFLLGTVNSTSLSVLWSSTIPSTTIIGTYSTTNLILMPKAYCNDDPCNNLQLTAEYCLGKTCSNYQPICDKTIEPCLTVPISVKIKFADQSNPCINPVYSGSSYYCWWDAAVPVPTSYYGQTIGLRTKATSDTATAYSNRVNYYIDSPPTVSLNQPSSQVTVKPGNILPIN